MDAAPPAEARPAPILTARRIADPDAPPFRAERWTDAEWGLSLVPPLGWTRSATQSLNPTSDPPDPVFEVARFQLRVGDPSLYAQPVALTSGLLADARAVISIGVAREGSGLIGAGPEKSEATANTLGFVATDDDLTYEGMRTFTRYLHATATDRVVVVRSIADEDEWPDVAPSLKESLTSVRAEPEKPHGPKALVPAPPPSPSPAPVVEQVDRSFAIRGQILTRAAGMLGVTYVWGGNSTRSGMDCSAYVSRAWGLERYSTDSIWNVSFHITKGELLPGDAVNLTTGRDPKRRGHIRIFEAWANAAHTLMWVYEETPPRAVHRVVVYDDRYQPIRLSGLSGAGVALLIPGTPAPERASPPRPRATAKATPRPTPRPTATPTPKPTPRLTVTPRPTTTPGKTPSPSPIPR
jgi:cell wall-associated NlpC family hydrolase